MPLRRPWQQPVITDMEANGGNVVPLENGEDIVPRPLTRKGSQAAAGTAVCQRGATRADVATLRQRANGGDEKAQAEIRRLIDANPDLSRRIGDLAYHAQMSFVRLVAQDDYLMSEAIKKRADEMRRELAGAFPTPLEIMAVERVAAAWLQVQYVEGQIALADAEIRRAKFWLQRQLQANRLLHAATKSLLLIRELLPPEGPPAALATNGTATSNLNGKGRLAVGMNGNGSTHSPTPAVALNRLNGTAKNGKPKALVTT